MGVGGVSWWQVHAIHHMRGVSTHNATPSEALHWRMRVGDWILLWSRNLSALLLVEIRFNFSTVHKRICFSNAFGLLNDIFKEHFPSIESIEKAKTLKPNDLQVNTFRRLRSGQYFLRLLSLLCNIPKNKALYCTLHQLVLITNDNRQMSDLRLRRNYIATLSSFEQYVTSRRF